MNATALSVFRAQILLARLIGLSVAITVYFAFGMLMGGGFDVASLLVVLLPCMIPPAATLGLLFAGQRRLASYASLLGTVPCTSLFLFMTIPLVASPGPYISSVVWALSSLPFLYTAITLARVGVGVRVTDGERRHARQLRAALTLGSAEEH